jgi:hypothetical protein
MKDMSNDSYSNRQTLSFKRAKKSDMVKGATDFSSELLKFQLPAGILPPDSHVYGELKRILTQQEIDELSEKIATVIKHKQLINSASKGPLAESIQIILEENEEMIKKNEVEIREKLFNVRFSRKDNQKKKLAKQMLDIALTGTIKNPPKNIEVFNQDDIEDFKKLLNDFTKVFKDVDNVMFKDECLNFIELIPFKEEFNIEQEQSANEEFIPTVDITRRDVLKWAFKNAPELMSGALKKSLDSEDIVVNKKPTNNLNPKK